MRFVNYFVDTPKFYRTMWLDSAEKRYNLFWSLYNLHPFSKIYSKSLGIQDNSFLYIEKHNPNKAMHVRCMLLVFLSLPSSWSKKAWTHHKNSYGSGFLSTSKLIKTQKVLKQWKIMLIIAWHDWIEMT